MLASAQDWKGETVIPEEGFEDAVRYHESPG